MGRPSLRTKRRAELIEAFAKVLSKHGYASATIQEIALEAGVAPGLVHHHFDGKDDLARSLFDDLVARFRARERARSAEESGDRLLAYLDAALALDARADRAAARCWVALFAESVRDPVLRDRVRRFVDGEIAAIESRSGGKLDAQAAGAVLAFVLGSLVLGAFAPARVAGFAAPAARQLVGALRSSPRA
jgi:TetR/AcrR family transcriptional repressor of bet genes